MFCKTFYRRFFAGANELLQIKQYIQILVVFSRTTLKAWEKTNLQLGRINCSTHKVR